MTAFRLLSLLVLAAGVQAQDARPLAVGAPVADSLGPESAHAFVLDLEAGAYVVGATDQVTTDVVVTITGPGGAEIAEVDGYRPRGPDPFSFTAERSGAHRLVVTPFEGEPGRYEIGVTHARVLPSGAEGEVARLFLRHVPADGPGAVAAAVGDGGPSWTVARGLADLERGLEAGPRTRFDVGPVAETMTAAAVLVLAREGQIDLEAPVQTYLPDVPDVGRAVTVRDLLAHRSGYRDVYTVARLQGRGPGARLHQRDLYDVIGRQPEAPARDLPRGRLTSRTDYMVLAEIVAAVTGRPFAEWVGERLFAPLGMRETTVKTSPEQFVPSAATPSAPGPDGPSQVTARRDGTYGWGNVHMTAGDLARWVSGLFGGAFGAEVPRQMVGEAEGREGYGLGLRTTRVNDVLLYEHGDDWPYDGRGSFATFRHDPAQGTGFVLLRNADGPLPSVVNRLTEETTSVTDHDLDLLAGPVARRPASPDRLPDLFGRYASAELGVTFTVEPAEGEGFARRDIQLRLPDGAVVPMYGLAVFDSARRRADNSFAADGLVYRASFYRAPDGDVATMVVDARGAYGVEFERVGGLE